MEDSTIEEGDNNRDMEVAPALIAVHPAQNSVVVAVGSDLRVFNIQCNCPVSLVDESRMPFHKDSIRAICYGANGKFLVSAGDDKIVKVWSTDGWCCICTVSSEKRVTAVAISNDGLFVCFADKFGVVWVVDLDGCHESQPLVSKKAVPILGHYCSIITSLEFSSDGRFIVTADRDSKIRVTVFPKKPLNGAHEIQSFCLGHTEFVSCIAFVCAMDHPDEEFLVSGSGDSTVRLWDITSGSLLDTYEVGAEAGVMQSDGKEGCCPAITDLCLIPNSSLVAVAIQSLSGLLLLSCSFSNRTLSFTKVISLAAEAFIPTSLGTSSSGSLLWMVTGVSNLQGSDSPSLARVRAVSGLSERNSDTGELEPILLEDNDVPRGIELLKQLQGSVSIERDVFLAAAESVKMSMRNLLIKKQYSVEKRDFRKRGRNDKKLKH